MFFVAVPEKYAGKNRIHVPESLFYPVNLLDDMLYLGYHGSAIKYNIVDKASGSICIGARFDSLPTKFFISRFRTSTVSRRRA
jgi:hypothetical protein